MLDISKEHLKEEEDEEKGVGKRGHFDPISQHYLRNVTQQMYLNASSISY